MFEMDEEEDSRNPATSEDINRLTEDVEEILLGSVTEDAARIA